MSSFKILLICPYFFEPHRWMISAYKTAHELSKKHHIIVLTTGKPNYEKLHPRLEIYRMKDLFLADPINYSIAPGLFYHVTKRINQLKPDLVLVNKYMFFTSFAIPLVRLLKLPVITVTDTFPGYNWRPRNRLVNLVMKTYHSIIGVPLLKASNCVVLLHEGLIEPAKKFKLNYQVIHNGVDFERFDSAKPADDIFDNERVTIGYIGRLESIKGYNDYLAVAHKLSSTDSRLKFYLIGNIAPHQQKLVKQHQSQQIIFTGLRQDIPSVMKALDIFVLPSYSEGLPNALMEAMASGCACISSNVGGAKILIKNGENGFLFEPGNQPELEKQLNQLITDKTLREKIGASAAQTIKKNYNWATITDQYNQLFKNLTLAKN